MGTDGNIIEQPDQEKKDITQIGEQTELAVMVSSFWRKIYTNYILRKIIKRTLQVALVILLLAFIFSWFVYITPRFQEIGVMILSCI